MNSFLFSDVFLVYIKYDSLEESRRGTVVAGQVAVEAGTETGGGAESVLTAVKPGLTSPLLAWQTALPTAAVT